MALISTGIKHIYDKVSPSMDALETQLRTDLDTITDGGEMTTCQLLQLQYFIARYTVSSSIYSNIIKEMADALKGTASKIG